MVRLFASAVALFAVSALAAGATPPPPGSGAPGMNMPGMPAQPPPPPPLSKDDIKKVMYNVGYLEGGRVSVFTPSKEEIAEIMRGFQDGLANKKGVNPQELMAKISQLAEQRQKERSVVEGKKSDEYLAKMEKEKGASKKPSGLIYFETKAGTGAQAKATDTVKVHYKGTLIDGTEFDSSYSRNQPADFPLNGVIPCWTEGVGLMKVGGKAKLICPSTIAYGPQGAPPKIPGGAALTFEVELLDAKAAPPPPPPGQMGMPGGAPKK